MKELKVSAIKEGTVIDHIPAKNTFKVAEILNLEACENVISVATNLKTRGKRDSTKGIIKLGRVFLKPKDVDKISIIAPNATINVIKDYKVVDKFKVSRPKEYVNIIKCFNPNCITNREPVRTGFIVESERPLNVRCHHCERVMDMSEIELI